MTKYKLTFQVLEAFNSGDLDSDGHPSPSYRYAAKVKRFSAPGPVVLVFAHPAAEVAKMAKANPGSTLINLPMPGVPVKIEVEAAPRVDHQLSGPQVDLLHLALLEHLGGGLQAEGRSPKSTRTMAALSKKGLVGYNAATRRWLLTEEGFRTVNPLTPLSKEKTR